LPLSLHSYSGKETTSTRNYAYFYQLGIFSYEHGDYARAVTFFTEALAKKTPLKVKKKCYEYLGIIYFIQGDKEKSREFFMSLLDIDPDYSLDPLFVPPEIVLFFNDLKSKRGQIVALSTPSPVSSATKQASLWKKISPYLPFGVGYLARGKRKKAIIFGIVQAFLLVTNISTYYYRRCELKKCSDKYYPPDVIGEAKTLQIIQLSAGYLWLGIWAYNIADILTGE